MAKTRIIAAAVAAAVLGLGAGALAQSGASHTVILDAHREAGVTAARLYINSMGGSQYATNDAYIQHVMDGAADSYCNNVPDANCP
jgi:hypothetical protein